MTDLDARIRGYLEAVPVGTDSADIDMARYEKALRAVLNMLHDDEEHVIGYRPDEYRAAIARALGVSE